MREALSRVWLVGDPGVRAFAAPVAAAGGECRMFDRFCAIEVHVNGKNRWLLLDPAIGTTFDFAPDEERIDIPDEIDTTAVAFTSMAAAERELAVRGIDSSIIDAQCILESLATSRRALLAAGHGEAVAALPVAASAAR